MRPSSREEIGVLVATLRFEYGQIEYERTGEKIREYSEPQPAVERYIIIRLAGEFCAQCKARAC